MKNLFTFTASVDVDFYVAGKTEDGHDYTAERFFVTVSNDYGLRFRHVVLFNGTTPFVDEEGYSHYPDHRDLSLRRANKLADRVNAALANGYVLQTAHWSEDAPVYGSDHYINSGEEAQRAFADREAA